MRICAVSSVAIMLFFQAGCVSMLSPTATPMRLRAYNEVLAAQYVSANQFEHQGKFEQARSLYQELHKKHPQNPDYLHRLAVVNTRLQRFGEARNFYERARLLDPKNSRLLADMGYSYYLIGDLSDAEEVLRSALRRKPNDPRAIRNLALVLGSRGKTEECLALLRQGGSEAEALGSLAYIHAQRGEIDAAEQRLREALTIDPNFKYATQTIADLTKRYSNNELADEMFSPSVVSQPRDNILNDGTENQEVVPVFAVIDPASENVITADFTQPSFASSEPELLEWNSDSEDRPATEAQPMLLIDEDDPAEEWTEVLPETSTSEPATHDDDWAND